MQKILVLRGGALGDFIVTLPALVLLRDRWPSAWIELIGNATAAQLARARGLLNAVHSQHEAQWSALFADTALPKELDAWLSGFDLIVNYWPDPSGELRRHFPRRDGQTFISAEAMPTCAPAAAHYCAPLRALGLETKNYFYPLWPLSAADRLVDVPATKHRIALHPGSGSPKKNWPAENWRALIARLPLPVSLILGEAEVERWSGMSPSGAEGGAIISNQPAGNDGIQLINRPLEELVTHLAGCRLFLGHDSGISHLAAATGVPCVLLFGPTEPAIWAPPAPNVRVLHRSPDLAALSVAEVHAAALAALGGRK